MKALILKERVYDIVEDGKEFPVHSGMKWAEGPCYIKSHKKLYFSDIPNNHLLSWDGSSVKIEKDPSNFINGNILVYSGISSAP